MSGKQFGKGWRLWRGLALSRTVMRQAPCPVLLGRQATLVHEPPRPWVDTAGLPWYQDPSMVQSRR